MATKQITKSRLLWGCVGLATMFGALATSLVPASAATVTFTGSLAYTGSPPNSDTDCTGSHGPCNLAASVTFDNSVLGQLMVTLANTSADDVYFPKELLLAVFWSGTAALSPNTAVLASGSSVVNDAAPAGGVVGGEFAYASGLNGPGSSDTGISAAGFGLFGDANFTGPNLAGNDNGAVQGMDYGITSSGDNTSTGNPQIISPGGNPYIKNAVVFTLFGTVGQTFNIAGIANVWFQYGTSLTEPSYQGNCTSGCSGGSVGEVPLPAALPLLLGGLGGMAWVARRQKRKGLTAT